MRQLIYILALCPLAVPLTARAEPACEPVVHDLRGPTEQPSLTRYEWLGASEDGTRVAVLFTREGPPYAKAIAYEAGERDPLVQFSFQKQAAELDREALESHVAEHVAPVLAGYEVSADQLPQPVPWCRDGDVVRVGGDHAGELVWKTWDETCDGSEGKRSQWSLCDESGTRCVVAPSLRACWEEVPELVDLYSAGGFLWVVAQRPLDRGTPRMVSGASWPR